LNFYNLIKTCESLFSEIKLMGVLYTRFYENLVTKEVEEVNANSNDIVLQIGCGAVPYTAEVIVRKTGAKVIAIDNDPKMVKRATAYVARQGISSNIQIKYGDGMNYPFRGFDIIIISLGVRPIAPILKKILSEANDGTRIVFREPQGFIGRSYSNTNDTVLISNAGEIIKQGKLTFRKSIKIVKRAKSRALFLFEKTLFYLKIKRTNYE